MGVLDTVKKIIQGDIAHDTADSGNPVKIGGRADTGVPAAVDTDGDRVNAWFDEYGRLIMRPQVINPAAATSVYLGGFLGDADAQAENTQAQGFALFGYNGTTYDRLRLDSNKALNVALATGLLTDNSLRFRHAASDGNRYSGADNQAAGGTAQYVFGLHATSTVDVRRVIVSSTVDTIIRIEIADLTSTNGTAITEADLINHNGGTSSSSSAILYKGTSTNFTIANARIVTLFDLLANTPMELRWDEMLILASDMLLIYTSANATISATVEWEER